MNKVLMLVSSLMSLSILSQASVFAASIELELTQAKPAKKIVKRFSTKGRSGEAAGSITTTETASTEPSTVPSTTISTSTSTITSTTAKAPPSKPAIATKVNAGTVVKPLLTKSTLNTPSVSPLAPFAPLTALNTTTPSISTISPLGAFAPLNADTDTVSPIGRWLNKGFGWINSTLGVKEVKPWQKATLAEPVMAGGVAPTLAKFATKVFISKEATLGGNGVAGGGCGCK